VVDNALVLHRHKLGVNHGDDSASSNRF
jgi:hypothetical protein